MPLHALKRLPFLLTSLVLAFLLPFLLNNAEETIFEENPEHILTDQPSEVEVERPWLTAKGRSRITGFVRIHNSECADGLHRAYREIIGKKSAIESLVRILADENKDELTREQAAYELRALYEKTPGLPIPFDVFEIILSSPKELELQNRIIDIVKVPGNRALPLLPTLEKLIDKRLEKILREKESEDFFFISRSVLNFDEIYRTVLRLAPASETAQKAALGLILSGITLDTVRTMEGKRSRELNHDKLIPESIENPRLRVLAARVLAVSRYEDPTGRVADLLMFGISDPEDAFRLECVRLLARETYQDWDHNDGDIERANLHERSFSLLMEAMEDPCEKVRLEICRFLEGIRSKDAGSPGAKIALREALKDWSARVRLLAAFAIYHLDAKAALSSLQKLKDHNSIEIRKEIASFLSELEDRDIFDFLSLLQDLDSGVRTEAVGSLRCSCFSVSPMLTRKILPIVETLLNDSHKEIRLKTLDILSDLDENATSIMPTFVKLITDLDRDVQLAAIKTLGKLEMHSAIPKLLKLLPTPDYKLELYVVQALEKMGVNGKRAVSSVEYLLYQK